MLVADERTERSGTEIEKNGGQESRLAGHHKVRVNEGERDWKE